MHNKPPPGANYDEKVSCNSAISTTRDDLSYFNHNFSQTQRNHLNTTPIRSTIFNPTENHDISIILPRLSFQYRQSSPFSIPFKTNWTILTAKKMLSPRFHVHPESIKLFLHEIELQDSQLIRDLRIPLNKHIQIKIERPINKQTLLFLMQHEAYRFEFPEETTVAEIKDELMRHANKNTFSIKLLYNGLYLDDRSVLKDLNISPKQCIIVESEMLEREDFFCNEEKNSETRARMSILMKRRRRMRSMNQNLSVYQPSSPKTAPNTPRIRKFVKQKNEKFQNFDENLKSSLEKNSYSGLLDADRVGRSDDYESDFEKIIGDVKDLKGEIEKVSLSKFKKLSNNFFSQIFVELDDSSKNEFPEKLFKWSFEKIHSGSDEQFVAGFCGFLFYLKNCEFTNEKLSQLPQLLMIILSNPQIDSFMASGISYLFNQIVKISIEKFNEFKIERYIEKVNHSSDFPIVSSLFIYYHSTKHDFQLLHKYSSFIETIVKRAILVPNRQVQKVAIKLNKMRLTFESSVIDSVENLLDDIKNELQNPNDQELTGLFLLLCSLFENNRNICEGKFNEIFLSIEIFFRGHSSENYLSFLSDFCEFFKNQINKEEEAIFSIVFSNDISFLNRIENCQNVTKIMKHLSSKFCPYINDVCCKMNQLSQDCYFVLMKSVIQNMPKIVDQQFVIDSFKKLELTKYFVDTFVVFIHVYKSNIFDLVKIAIQKIESERIESIQFLSEISFLNEFPLSDFWNVVFDCLKKSEEFRVASIQALNSMIQRFEPQEQNLKFFSILMFAYNDESSKVKLAFLNSIDDRILPLFESSSLFLFLKEFYYDDDFEVSKASLSLMNKSSSLVLNFFNEKLNEFSDVFYQIPTKKEQKKFLKILPYLIKKSDDAVISHSQRLTDFLLKILNSKSFHFTCQENRMSEIANIKNDIKIRIFALKSFRSLIKIDSNNQENLSESIESITNQLFVYKKRGLHISALKTLRTFFHNFKICESLFFLNFNKRIFQFIQTSPDAKVNLQVLKLLGSIGPLVFPEVKIARNQELYPLFDSSKREQSFLNFVMNYILKELRTKDKRNDLSSLSKSILYIFQHDAQKCLDFLDPIVDIFSTISDFDYFHFFKVIVSAVGIRILPHAGTIYKLVFPSLVPKMSLEPVELLNTLIFELKVAFVPYSNSTFSKICSILNENCDLEVENALLLSLTLIVIYANGSLLIYFNTLKSVLKSRKQNLSGHSLYPFLFLGQVLYNCPSEIIIIPSLRIAFQLHESKGILDEIAFSLINVLLIKYSEIISKLPLDEKSKDFVDQVKSRGHKIESIRNIINCNLKSKKDFLKDFEPTPSIQEMQADSSYTNETIKNVIFNKMKSFVDAKDWLLQITQSLVLCSKSPAIRGSFELLTQSPKFASELFPYVIVSVWENSTEEERSLLSDYLLSIVDNNATDETLSVIAEACDLMDRSNFSLFEKSSDCGRISERSCSLYEALRFYGKSNDKEFITNLLRIDAILKQKEAALGLLQIYDSHRNDSSLLEALSMWSEARRRCQLNHDLVGFLRCSMHLEDWESVGKHIDDFNSYNKEMKQEVALIFATAARNTNKNPTFFLNEIKNEDPMTCMLHSIVLIDQNQLDDAAAWIRKGLSLICLNKTSFSSHSYEPAIHSICLASNFVELNDIISQKKKKKSKNQILKRWKLKSSDYIKRDATQLCYVCHLRELFQWNEEQLLNFHIDFVEYLRKLKEWELFDQNFNRLFKNCNDERVMLIMAKSQYDRGIIKNLSVFEEIIKRLTKNDGVYCDAICAYASRFPISPDIILKIKEVIEIQPARVCAWKYWSYFNFGCIKKGEKQKNIIEFASNAIQGFSKLVQLTSPSFHYLCQLCSIFFTYGPKLYNFKDMVKYLTSLSNSSILQIIPQLFIQLNHSSEEVRETVYIIIKKFAEKHFQALTMPLCFISNTNTKDFHNFLLKIMNDFKNDNHMIVMKEAKNFVDSMITIAITDIEKVLQLLDTVINYQQPNNHIQKITSLFERIKVLLKKEHYGYVANVLSRSIVQLILIKLDEINNPNIALGDQYKSNAIRALSILYQRQELYSTIDINEMNIPNFPYSPLSLVVPGFYSVNEKPITIEKICKILKTIPSQKKPRKIRIIGSNGKKYKYLLKGREDLRLDQRVMQLFLLINCILQEDKYITEKNIKIHGFPIIPLATNAGLIAWAERGETLYSLINWHRRIIKSNYVNEKNKLMVYDDNSNIEQNYIHFIFNNNIGYAIKLSSIQKLELYRTLCSLSPDDDLRESLWLRSTNSEIWFSQINNFARSNGLMSIIGYIVGIGDRHPSNILVKKDTGNVVHIDFSDVFEKANFRSYVHETVPFRLTRMIVRALGPSGFHGVFEFTAKKILSLLRKNKETILAFLDIFVQDPISDTLWYSNFDNKMISDDDSNLNLSLSSVSESISNCIDDEIADADLNEKLRFSILEKAIERVKDKLNGNEFENQKLEPSEQTDKLIEIATNEMNLAQMFYGWVPYW